MGDFEGRATPAPEPWGDLQALCVDEIGEHYARYRLPNPDAERAMESSMRRYGQLCPLIVCHREGRVELIDGFKRLAAARRIQELHVLAARFFDVDDRAAKVALYGLNQLGRHMQQLEEAWIVHALVREDGLSQTDVAELLGRHKSWVTRRLAILERLSPDVTEDLRLGLISPSVARELTRLPAGNQGEVLAAGRRESLSATELRGVVDLFLASGNRSQQEFVLDHPRNALSQSGMEPVPATDPRLSPEGNRFSRQVAHLQYRLSQMEARLRLGGLADLSISDRVILSPPVGRLSEEALVVAELAEDFCGRIKVA